MIESLTVLNLAPHAPIKESHGDVFILKTCQRTLIIGFSQLPFYHLENQKDIKDVFLGQNGYVFLLETICGLKSEVLAEYEVVAQFKEAYAQYHLLKEKNSHIMAVLDKLFSDSKKIRTDHLTGISQLSYAGIVRKLIINKNLPTKKILIVGSGALSEDLIKLLMRKYELSITARNTDKVSNLVTKYSLNKVQWKNYEEYNAFDIVINTIGASEILFDEAFFRNWKSTILPVDNINSQMKRLFIDLGSPTVIKTELQENDGIYRLEDVFKHGSELKDEKLEKIRLAKQSIEVLALNRKMSFSLSFPFGWEELQFA